MLPDIEGMYKRMADIPQLARGIVWCTVCGASHNVKAEKCLREGWPKCCGYTMTIDSPEEREQLAKRRSGSAEGSR